MRDLSERAWNYRYAGKDTPWDLGRAHPLLTEALSEDATLGLGRVDRAYVPGCGRGWDAAALENAGWETVAVDLSEQAIADAQSRTSATQGDALTWPEVGFDLIFDHTFFCAIDPARRSEFGAMVDRMLSPDGQLVSIVFPIGRPPEEGGPPFAMDPEDVDVVLGDGFTRVATGERATIGRPWPHRLCRWRRRTD